MADDLMMQLAPFLRDWRRSTRLAPGSGELDATAWARFFSWLSEWPPDMFAVTSVLLNHDTTYRVCVSPGAAEIRDTTIEGSWPNHPEWIAQVRELARAWRIHVNRELPGTPAATEPAMTPFFFMCALRLWRLIEHEDPLAGPEDGPDPLGQERTASLSCLFALHAIADEACAGLGVPGAPNVESDFALQAELLLSDEGSLSRFHPANIRVLPKLRTPQRGLTLRSFSHHCAAVRSNVAVTWVPTPPMNVVADDDRERLDLLIIPWPLVSAELSVAPASKDGAHLPPGWGYFNMTNRAQLDTGRVVELIHAAEARADDHRVHGVIFPEAALSEAEFNALSAALYHPTLRVGFMLAGVHGLQSNEARLRVLSGIEVAQHKHHRWCLERSQLEQYGFTASLNATMQWWENIKLGSRRLTFLPASRWFTMCHVICEDLARLDPIDHVIRSVGPTLLVALLQDGPQLRTRWPGRFATVYADDPGSSVLTVTSLAMAERYQSGFVQQDQKRVIALWSEQGQYPKELSLDAGCEALWLSLQADRCIEYSADGRTDGGWSARLTLRDQASIRAPTGAAPTASPVPGGP